MQHLNLLAPRFFDGSDAALIDAARAAFEAEAKPYGFDLTRHQCAAPEPWSEYADAATGHRWAGWLAAFAAQERMAADAARRGGWCKPMGLPCSVNPVLTVKYGMMQA